MATKTRLIKLCFYAKRKPHLTEDEFHDHWTVKHRALVGDWLAKYGIVKYTQYHTHPSSRTAAIAGFPDLQGIPVLEFDGVAEFLMPDSSCFHKAREDPYYEQVVMPDENRLFEWETARWSAGWEEVYIEDGKVVDGVKSSD